VLADSFTRVASQTALPQRLVQFGSWFALGVIGFVLELGLLAILHQWLGMHLWMASAVAGETMILGRFLTNDRFVFGHATPSFGRCWRYHVASAGSFTVSWLVLNGSAHALQVPYPVAAFLGSAASFVWSALTNFLWVWRQPAAKR
jgi:putative flippase GtrA